MPPRSYPLFEHPLLRASASLEGRRMKVAVRGPLSSLPGIKRAVGMIDGQIPALAGEKLYISTWFPPVGTPAFERLMRSQIRAMFGWRTPDQVTVSITEECPNRCQHCALPDSGRHLRLQPDVVKDVISQILDLGTTLVIFDGGEPTTYKELPELVASVDGRAVSTLFTSGAGFTPPLAVRLKEAGLHAVNVSLDSPVPEEHDAMRGRQGVFADAMKATEAALEAGLLVNIYAVVRKGNIGRLDEFHNLARKVGAHELTFFEAVPTGRWEGKGEEVLSDEERSTVQSFSSPSPPRVFSVPSALSTMGCFAGRSWMHITPAGEVYPCACLPVVAGSIHDSSLKDIWRRMGALPYKGRKTCPMREGGHD